MRKLIIILITILLILGLSSCSSTNLNVAIEGEVNPNPTGFVEICNSPIILVYDSMTNIIYIENSTYAGGEVYTPYYAPNGLPYRYNPEKNLFEEIKSE